jgi:hypothetical protein
MLKFKRTSGSALLLFLLVVIGIAPVWAGTASVSGRITKKDPTIPVIYADPPFCHSQGTEPLLHYDVYPFTVTQTGTYSFDDPPGFVDTYMFENTFDPANAFPTCIAAIHSNSTYTIELTAGTQYFLVPFWDYHISPRVEAYTITASGPGDILFPRRGHRDRSS